VLQLEWPGVLSGHSLCGIAGAFEFEDAVLMPVVVAQAHSPIAISMCIAPSLLRRFDLLLVGSAIVCAVSFDPFWISGALNFGTLAFPAGTLQSVFGAAVLAELIEGKFFVAAGAAFGVHAAI
jgi:hypothetical protein